VQLFDKSCTMFRTFRFSDDLFQGFTVSLEFDGNATMKSVISDCVQHLRITLKQLRLEILVERLEKKHFHVHDVSMEQIFASSEHVVFWICSH
jgi:hypothetical protein